MPRTPDKQPAAEARQGASATAATCGSSGSVHALAGGVTIAALLLLVGTLGDPGMAWDEGITIRRQERIRAWFAEVFHPAVLTSRRAAFLDEVIVNLNDRPHLPLRSYWPYTRVIEGHPPFYGILGVIGWCLSHGWLPPLQAHRFGPALLFALTCGATCWSLARSHGRAAGLCAAAALLFMPRMFAHAHLASYDAPVTCFWILAWAAFLPARECTRWKIVFGIVLGLALATKFTGWLAPLPFLLWSVLYWDTRAIKALAVGGLIALATFYAVNPPLWNHPISGMQEFLAHNLHRGDIKGLNISTFFLARSYDLDHSIPWFNTVFWTVAAVPVGTVALAMVGIARVLAGRFADRAATLVLLHWGLMIVLRALPGAPPHDGIRLFLPSFAFLAALAGIGAAAVFAWGVRRTGAPLHGRQPAQKGGQAPRDKDQGRGSVWPARTQHPFFNRLVGTVTVGAALAGSAWSTWLYHPMQLSHYSLLLGGLPGAVRLGMEPTYYWEALTDDALAWLNENTPRGRTVAFSTQQNSWRYVSRWGMLRPAARGFDMRANADSYVAWYVLQLRPSSYKPMDWKLVRSGAKPAYVKRLHHPPRWNWGAMRLDVPLIHVYSASQVEAVGANRNR